MPPEEIKVIDGILHHRFTTSINWTPYTTEELTSMYIRLRDESMDLVAFCEETELILEKMRNILEGV